MILCDIGNTSYHFLTSSDDYKEQVNTFNPKNIQDTVYYICVNTHVSYILNALDNWINIAKYIDMKQYYETMGVDRIFACEAIKDGVIVDAGSAITVDVVSNGTFVGGFIYPGAIAMNKTYENISSALKYDFNYKVSLDSLPKNSVDAISYGFLKTLYSEVISYKKEIYLTGGDASKLLHVFNDAQINKRLIFDGMKKILLAMNK